MFRTVAIHTLLFFSVLLGGGAGASANSSFSMPFGVVAQMPDRLLPRGGFPGEGGVQVSQANCAGAAAQAAAQTGGQVLSVSSRRQGNRVVCVVTVLVPGRDGERPRKTTINIPQ